MGETDQCSNQKLAIRSKLNILSRLCREGGLVTQRFVNALIHSRWYTVKSFMATLARVIPVSESLLRREAVENAIADLRLEGLVTSSEVREMFDRFVQGDLTHQQLLDAVLSDD